MRAILYLKQILLTHPHLKKYRFPICARRTELACQLHARGPLLGQSHGQGAQGAAAQGRLGKRGKKPSACIYMAVRYL